MDQWADDHATPNGGSSVPDDDVRRALRLGVCGPVGTGKTSLIGLLCRELGPRLLGVITNDIYTDEDARMLRAAGVLRPSGSAPWRPGRARTPRSATTSPPTCLGIEDLERDFAPLDLVLIESGGDNLTATFSPALVDAQVFVLDVAGGGDVVRKGGPGIGRADLLVVNKTDLAPHVGVDADLMVRQGRRPGTAGPSWGCPAPTRTRSPGCSPGSRVGWPRSGAARWCPRTPARWRHATAMATPPARHEHEPSARR